MPIVIKKLQVNSSQPITRRIMLYGDSGAGKTFLAGTAQDVPEMADVLVANIDKGVATLLSRGDIQTTDIAGASNLEELLWMLVRKDAAVANIRTVVLDGGSELQKLDLAEIAEAAAKDKSKERDRDVNQLNDYMKNKNRLLRVFRMARDIPGINLIITAWAAKKYPNDNKNAEPNVVQPEMTDAVRSTLVGYMDDVWYISHDDKSNTRYLVTSTTKGIFAKTRDQAVAAQLTTDGKAFIANPTFATIYAAYKKAYLK